MRKRYENSVMIREKDSINGQNMLSHFMSKKDKTLNCDYLHFVKEGANGKVYFYDICVSNIAIYCKHGVVTDKYKFGVSGKQEKYDYTTTSVDFVNKKVSELKNKGYKNIMVQNLSELPIHLERYEFDGLIKYYDMFEENGILCCKYGRMTSDRKVSNENLPYIFGKNGIVKRFELSAFPRILSEKFSKGFVENSLIYFSTDISSKF